MTNDDEFKKLLISRIERYIELERPVVEQIRVLESTLEDLQRRRRSAEALYKTEFGEAPVVEPRDDRTAAEGESQYAAAPVGPLFALSWAEGIRHVLAEAGEPLHVKAIWERMAQGGFRSSSKDPTRSIVSIAIRNADTFRRVGPNRFALAENEEGGEA